MNLNLNTNKLKMNNSSMGGDFDALNAYLSHNTTSGGNGLTESVHSLKPTLNDAKDEQQMQVARLMNDLKNIR